MESVLEHLIMYKHFYALLIILVLLIILIILSRPKKVKPIEITIDDVKETEKTDIEKVIESLQENKNSRPMTTFEEEQEANAIISYQELVEAVRLKKEMMAPSEIKTSVAEVEPEINTIEVETPVIEEQEEPKKFKSSEFISPIFGKDSNKTNDDFLKELKDFRSNL